MAVAIWDHRPTAAEILDRRVASGWVPTASALKDGQRVLGYAACVVSGEHRAPEG
jgi:hypothetical protein